MEMRFSENKLEAIKACTDTFDEFLAYVFPIFSYHTRWKELNSTDFQIFDYSANASVRGYNLVTDKVLITPLTTKSGFRVIFRTKKRGGSF